MTEWTQGARPHRGGLAWLAAGAAAVTFTLASAGPAAAQTTGTTGTTRTTTTGTTTAGGSTTTAASSQPAVSQSALFEQFLFEVMIELIYEDFLAMGGGTPDQFLTFLEGTLGELLQPELAAAGSGQGATLPDAGDDEFLAFEEFLMEFFVAQAQADFNARGGGTAAQFQTFLANALVTAGQPQLAAVAQQVAAADAAAARTSTTGTTTTGTTTTGSTTTTGTRTTTTGTTGTTGTTTTGTRTGTTGTTTTPGG